MAFRVSFYASVLAANAVCAQQDSPLLPV